MIFAIVITAICVGMMIWAFIAVLKRATAAGYNAGLTRGVAAMTVESARFMSRLLAKLEVCPNAVRIATVAIEMEDSIAERTGGAQGEVKALERMYSGSQSEVEDGA